MAEIIGTVCQMCNRFCGMNVHVKSGRIVKVEGMPSHGVSRGGLCPRGLAAVQYEYDAKRLMHPLARVGERGEGRWKVVSWDEAMDTTAKKLSQVKEKHGPEAVFFYKGQGNGWGTVWSHVKRFMNVWGSPNYGAHSHLCYIPMMMGHIYTMGGVPMPDVEHTRCMVLWGYNPFTSNVANAGRRILDARARGAKLIVIDPRFASAASKADLFLRPRPGTDGALALGMLNVVLAEGLHDTEFVAKWTYGFDKLAKFLEDYAPGKVEAITGVPASMIREAARLYATTKPASIGVGNGIEQHTNSVQTARAIAILMSISGNLDKPGGNVFHISPSIADITLADRLLVLPKAIEKHPLYYRIWFVPGSDMLDTLLTGDPYPIRAMIVMGGDPATSLSDTRRARDALKRLDFIVVHDLFPTAAAELADVVLPSASWLESAQVCVYNMNASPSVNSQYIALRNKVVEPPGECHSDFEFLRGLARRLNLVDYFTWDTLEEAFDEELRPTGITVEDLRQHPEGIAKTIDSQLVYGKHESQGFRTPTKKVELYSTTFEKYGYDPLPTYEEPGESPFTRPDLAREYPLVCGAGVKPVLFTHNQFRTVPLLRDIMPEPLLEINPTKARELGVADGDLVAVESPRGTMEVKAKYAPDIAPGTVFLPHGWGQPYADGPADNDITPDSPRCPLSGSTANRSFLCRVSVKGRTHR